MATIGKKKSAPASQLSTGEILAKASTAVTHDQAPATEETVKAEATAAATPKKASGKPSLKDLITKANSPIASSGSNTALGAMLSKAQQSPLANKTKQD